MKKINQYTNYGVRVRSKLLEQGKTITQLAEEIGKHTGLYVDQQYLYKIFTGVRNAPKIVTAINEVLGIQNEEQK